MKRMLTVLSLLVVSLGPLTARADDKKLCEETWPNDPKPIAKTAHACATYFDQAYLAPAKDHPEEAFRSDFLWAPTAEQMGKMADAIDAVCKKDGVSCGGEMPRTATWLRAAGDSHFDVTDSFAQAEITPVLMKLIHGDKITKDDLMYWSGVTLWRFRNAPYARHGRPFKSPDLNKFFYEDATIMLQKDASFKDSMLDKNDEANVALVVKAMNGELGLPKNSRAHDGVAVSGDAPYGCDPCGGDAEIEPTQEDAVTKFCVDQWPGQKSPSAADTVKCVDYFSTAGMSGTVVWRLTAAQFAKLSERAGACTKCEHAKNAQMYFGMAARAHFELDDPVTNRPLEGMLGRALAGQKLDANEISGLSSVSLWKLRNAPYARHGRPFKSPDLQIFYYGDRGKDAPPTKLLPLKPNPAFKDSMLDKVDESNVALVVAEIKRRGG